MIHETVRQRLETIPLIQNIDKMVGSNPWVDIAQTNDFVSFMANVAQNYTDSLPSFAHFNLYFQERESMRTALVNALSRFIKTNDRNDMMATANEVLCFIANKKLSHEADQYIARKPLLTIADFIEKQQGYALAEKILSQFKKLLTLYATKSDTPLYELWYSSYAKYNVQWRQLLKNLPKDPEKLIVTLLEQMSLNNDNQYLSVIMQNYPGWFGYLKNNAHHAVNHSTHLLAIWLANELFYLRYGANQATELLAAFKLLHSSQTNSKIASLADILPSASYPYLNRFPLQLSQCKLILLEALEASIETNNRTNIAMTHIASSHQNRHAPLWIFCMDPRSEIMRNVIECTGHGETLGCAGFFNLPLQLSREQQHIAHYPGEQDETFQTQAPVKRAHELIYKLTELLEKQRKRIGSAFMHYELFGFLYLFKSIVLNVLPSAVTSTQQKNIIHWQPHTDLLVKNIRSLFISMGINRIQTETVYIVGHYSALHNNHYHTCMQCAACGGNTGEYNAEALCDILNDQGFRQAIGNDSFQISDATQFIPLKHNTAKNSLQGVLPNHNNQYDDLQKKLIAINQVASETTANSLPAIDRQKSQLWSQLVPEFGLSNHSCLIIGPRELTKGKNLEQSAFLHSYDHQLDEEGKVLAAIFAGPVYVAHQLNMQYFFSAANNTTFGSGDKARHSIIPGVGVLTEESNELRYGLPMQSIAFQEKPQHIPCRLTIYIAAPQATIDKALIASPAIAQLKAQQWLKIVSIFN